MLSVTFEFQPQELATVIIREVLTVAGSNVLRELVEECNLQPKNDRGIE